LGVAGLWCRWKNPATGEWHNSFTMLAINADSQPIFQELHRPDKKRPPDKQDNCMVVILNEYSCDAWLNEQAEKSREFFMHYPAEKLMVACIPKEAQAILF
jgi:putative SOS response-associated peptidase YedK